MKRKTFFPASPVHTVLSTKLFTIYPQTTSFLWKSCGTAVENKFPGTLNKKAALIAGQLFVFCFLSVYRRGE
jgi:hypothetical protein